METTTGPKSAKELDDNHMRSATYVSTYDGDTFHAIIQMIPSGSIKLALEAKVRVHNFNAVEMNDAEGPHMRDVFEAALVKAKEIRVRMGSMSHDRFVCDVWLDGVLFAGELHAKLATFRAAARHAKLEP